MRATVGSIGACAVVILLLLALLTCPVFSLRRPLCGSSLRRHDKKHDKKLIAAASDVDAPMHTSELSVRSNAVGDLKQGAQAPLTASQLSIRSGAVGDLKQGAQASLHESGFIIDRLPLQSDPSMHA